MKKLQLCTLAFLLALPHTVKADNNSNLIAGCIVGSLVTTIAILKFLQSRMFHA